MSYFSLRLHDALEHLFRYRSLEKELIKALPLTERRKLEEILKLSIERSYVSELEDRYALLDPLGLLTELTSRGLDVGRLVDFIEWSEFEDYVAHTLKLSGFETYVDYQHRGLVRFQIDVLGLDTISKIGLVIECKHWRRIYKQRNKLADAVKEHIRRIERLVKFCEWVAINIPAIRRVRIFIPALIVLRPLTPKVVDGVPIVALSELSDFVNNLESYVDELDIRRYENRCYVR